jgi:Rieske Fe-S protein
MGGRKREFDLSRCLLGCLHSLGCKVHWEEERNAFICPCHDGVFDKAGNLVSGPPPEPLHRFQTRLDNDQLMVYVEA